MRLKRGMRKKEARKMIRMKMKQNCGEGDKERKDVSNNYNETEKLMSLIKVTK